MGRKTKKTRKQRTELVSKYEALTLKGKEEEKERKKGKGKEEEEEEEEEDPLLTINWAEAPWPPVWKERIEESRQYACGMLTRFLKRWPVEDLAEEKPDSYFHVPPLPRQLSGLPPPVNIHRTLITLLHQVRKSRGYDVDVNAPWFVHSPFFAMTHLLEQGEYQTQLKKELSPIMTFVLAQINTNAKPHGKCYGLVKVVKYVDAMPHRTSLITFTVKEEIAPANNININININVEQEQEETETIQAMVYTGCCLNEYRLMEWRFKPNDD